mgnify:FL=1
MKIHSIKMMILLAFVMAGMNVFSQDFSRVQPGMSLADFKQAYPGAVKQAEGDQKVGYRDETILDLKGSWTFNFRGDILVDYYWSAYVDEVNRENFEKCYNVTQQLVGRYRKLIGEPVKTETGHINFRDPATDPHQGYDVKHFWWETNSSKTHIGFKFLAGDSYRFQVVMEFEKK